MTDKPVEDVVEEVEVEEEVVLTEDEPTVEEKLQKELDAMEDQYLRAQAEIVNMTNRNKKERADAAKYRSQNLAKELLPALDNLERALAIDVDGDHGESMKKGIEMVLDSMVHALNEAGVTEIEVDGQKFDPNLHQAVQTVPVEEGQEADEIIQVLQKGYVLHDRILRPAMVVVSQ